MIVKARLNVRIQKGDQPNTCTPPMPPTERCACLRQVVGFMLRNATKWNHWTMRIFRQNRKCRLNCFGILIGEGFPSGFGKDRRSVKPRRFGRSTSPMVVLWKNLLSTAVVSTPRKPSRYSRAFTRRSSMWRDSTGRPGCLHRKTSTFIFRPVMKETGFLGVQWMCG